MRLVRIRRVGFDVLAVHEDGETQVLEKLNEIWSSHYRLWEAASAALYVDVPQQGPTGAVTVRRLYEPLWEFIFGRRPGVGFRVVWFYGSSPQKIVCSNAFVKGERASTPDEMLTTASRHHELYQADLARNRIRITDMEIGELYDTH